MSDFFGLEEIFRDNWTEKEDSSTLQADIFVHGYVLSFLNPKKSDKMFESQIFKLKKYLNIKVSIISKFFQFRKVSKSLKMFPSPKKSDKMSKS